MCQKLIKKFHSHIDFAFSSVCFHHPHQCLPPTGCMMPHFLFSFWDRKCWARTTWGADWFMSYFRNSWTLTNIFDSLMTWPMQTTELFLGSQPGSCCYHALVILKFLSPESPWNLCYNTSILQLTELVFVQISCCEEGKMPFPNGNSTLSLLLVN